MSYLFSYFLTPFFADQFFHPFLPLSMKMGYKCDVIYEWPYIGAGGWEGKRGIRLFISRTAWSSLLFTTKLGTI